MAWILAWCLELSQYYLYNIKPSQLYKENCYIRNWPLQAVHKIKAEFFYTTYVEWVTFYSRVVGLQLKVHYARQFEKLFVFILIYSQNFYHKSTQEKPPKEVFFSWSCLAWGLNPGLMPLKANTVPTILLKLQKRKGDQNFCRLYWFLQNGSRIPITVSVVCEWASCWCYQMLCMSSISISSKNQLVNMAR